jgi:ADP-ribose pyrophosphatase YjhB (NUDIX family)
MGDAKRCCGAVLMRGEPGNPQLLLVRTEDRVLDLPKGYAEPAESLEQGALRELKLETGVENPPETGPQLSSISYRIEGDPPATKEVSFFLFVATEPLAFGPLHRPGRELRWIRSADVDHVPLENETLRTILRRAFDGYRAALERGGAR